MPPTVEETHTPGRALHGHTATLVGDDMVVVGGCLAEAGGFNFSTYIFSFTTERWRYGRSLTTCDSARYRHTAVALDGRVYLHGGHGQFDGMHSDLWYFDLKMLTWAFVEENGTKIGPRAAHSSTSHAQHLYFFGGVNEQFQPQNDLFSFDPRNGMMRRLSKTFLETKPCLNPRGTRPCMFDDTDASDTEIGEITPNVNPPSPRSEAGICLYLGILWVLGGTAVGVAASDNWGHIVKGWDLENGMWVSRVVPETKVSRDLQTTRYHGYVLAMLGSWCYLRGHEGVIIMLDLDSFSTHSCTLLHIGDTTNSDALISCAGCLRITTTSAAFITHGGRLLKNGKVRERFTSINLNSTSFATARCEHSIMTCCEVITESSGCISIVLAAAFISLCKPTLPPAPLKNWGNVKTAIKDKIDALKAETLRGSNPAEVYSRAMEELRQLTDILPASEDAHLYTRAMAVHTARGKGAQFSQVLGDAANIPFSQRARRCKPTPPKRPKGVSQSPRFDPIFRECVGKMEKAEKSESAAKLRGQAKKCCFDDIVSREARASGEAVAAMERDAEVHRKKLTALASCSAKTAEDVIAYYTQRRAATALYRKVVPPPPAERPFLHVSGLPSLQTCVVDNASGSVLWR